jgi:hypothetical protein
MEKVLNYFFFSIHIFELYLKKGILDVYWGHSLEEKRAKHNTFLVLLPWLEMYGSLLLIDSHYRFLFFFFIIIFFSMVQMDTFSMGVAKK